MEKQRNGLSKAAGGKRTTEDGKWIMTGGKRTTAAVKRTAAFTAAIVLAAAPVTSYGFQMKGEYYEISCQEANAFMFDGTTAEAGTTGQLVLSKLICALATTVVNGIVGILAMFLMMPLNWDEIFDTQLWQAVFRNLVQQPDIILYFLEFLLLLLVMCAAMFMNFYLAMSIGHLFSRRRILMSVVAFFGLNILDSVITSTLHNMDMMNWLYGMDLSDHAGYWLGILLLLIPTVIMFLLTSWILKHKLNLE